MRILAQLFEALPNLSGRRACRHMPATDSLQEQIDLYLSHGRILREDTELFPVQSWLSVMICRGVVPRSYDLMADGIDLRKIETRLDVIRAKVRARVEAIPANQDFIDKKRVDRSHFRRDR